MELIARGCLRMRRCCSGGAVTTPDLMAGPTAPSRTSNFGSSTALTLFGPSREEGKCRSCPHRDAVPWSGECTGNHSQLSPNRNQGPKSQPHPHLSVPSLAPPGPALFLELGKQNPLGCLPAAAWCTGLGTFGLVTVMSPGNVSPQEIRSS